MSVPTEVAVQMIATLGALGVAIISAAAAVRANRKLDGVKRDAAATLEQVANDHPTNMREENDSRHAETKQWFGELRRDLGGIRGDLRLIAERVQVLEELEITSPRPRKDTPT